METIRVTQDEGKTVSLLEVERPIVRDCKPLRVAGRLTINVRETDASERSLVAGQRYAATWLGWSRGQCPAYGPTPETAARRLASGETC